MPLVLRLWRFLSDDAAVAVRPDWLRRAGITVGFPAFALGVLAALLLLTRFPGPSGSFLLGGFSVREVHSGRDGRAPARRGRTSVAHPSNAAGGRR